MEDCPSPSSDSETTVSLKLFGRNEVRQVEVNGWTHDIPINFPGLNEDLKIKSIRLSDIHAEADTDGPASKLMAKLRKNVATRDQVTLETMSNGAWPCETVHRITKPVEVLVLAKKKIDLVVKNGNPILFGNMLVADKDGYYCLLKVANDSIACLYDEVSPGDRILLTDGTYCRSDDLYCVSPFRKDFLLNLTVKITSFQCRNVYRLLGYSSTFNFPEPLTTERDLFIPSDLVSSEGSIRVFEDDECVDIVGVISHVSRMERSNRFSCPVELAEGDFVNLPQYNAFRWIELVDETVPTPLPVKIYVNKCTWEQQRQLIPGAVVVITFAEKAKASFGYDHLTTSRFSTIYTNAEIGRFMKLLPDSEKKSGIKLLGAPASLRILKREDVVWTVGGAYARPFKSEIGFCQFYHERREAENRQMSLHNVPFLPMERRQVEYVAFKGEILRHRPVEPKSPILWTWVNKGKLKPKCCSEIDEVIPDFVNQLWYLFTRKLPQVAYEPPQKRVRGRTYYYQTTADANAKYCGPLLMPAVQEPSLKDLPPADGLPHYILNILNLEVPDGHPLQQYNAVWKPSRHLSFDQMKQKLEASKGKPVLVLMEVHRIETIGFDKNGGFEILLQDFTAVLDPLNFLADTNSQAQDEDEATDTAACLQNSRNSTASAESFSTCLSQELE